MTIFDDLLALAEDAFNKSDLRKSNFGISICGTPIQEGKPIIIGINWGGGGKADKSEYFVQKKMPSKDDFINKYHNGEYNFLRRSATLLKDYFDLEISQGNFNYTNLCFFRTPKASDLTFDDKMSCLPIFEKFVKSVKPEWILSLGNSNIPFLQPEITEYYEANTEGTAHKGYGGNLWGFRFYCVPHPRARKLTNELRNAIWQNIFSCKLKIEG